MKKIHVYGGIRLCGKVRIQGSKNAALPVLAATILTGDTNLISNCPVITDVYQMLNLLQAIGCSVCRVREGVRIDAGCQRACRIPEEMVKQMRSSMYLMGVLLSENHEVIMDQPGGCVIGSRPIDLHLSALEKMGAQFSECGSRICGMAPDGLHGAEIVLRLPSVGATENIILAAVKAQGVTKISGAATEPEVVCLCQYLNRCGADITGVGTSKLLIRGVKKLHGTCWRIPADRIVAGTYLFACLGTGGRVLLEEAPIEDMASVLELANAMGASFDDTGKGLYVQGPSAPVSPKHLITMPYPGFPTDLQSVALAVLTIADGMCMIEETIFENRFRIVEPLARMGACITQLSENIVQVRGPVTLKGMPVTAGELRGGAALIVAGLLARGETIVEGGRFVDRGYENICRDFKELGARIYCE